MNACTPNKTEIVIRRTAGLMVIVSTTMAWFVHPAWILLAGFVGLNLFQSSCTGWCPLESILNRNKQG